MQICAIHWSLILSSATPPYAYRYDCIKRTESIRYGDVSANENSMNSIYFGLNQAEHNLLIAGAFMVRYHPSSQCKIGDRFAS